MRRDMEMKERPGHAPRPVVSFVAPTGFEPATSALRGRRPKPLDDGATWCAVQYTVKMAGVEGVEPSHTAPETAVLPLDDTPSAARCAPRRSKTQARVNILRATLRRVKPPMPEISKTCAPAHAKAERRRRFRHPAGSRRARLARPRALGETPARAPGFARTGAVGQRRNRADRTG